MRNKISFIFIALILLFNQVFAQSVGLEYFSSGIIPGTCNGSWCTQDFSTCGTSIKHFRISFLFPGGVSGTCNSGNPANYEFHTTLYRDGVQLAPTMTGVGLGGLYPEPGLSAIPTQPGKYYAQVVFKKKQCIPLKWVTVGTYTSNVIHVIADPAVPNFRIKNVLATDDHDNVKTVSFTNGEIIEVDASTTSCETRYFVGIWETGTNWWERTYNYEWGQWFTGAAPALINLQNLATNSASYSFTGPSSRKGQILFGGNVAAVSIPPGKTTLEPYQSTLTGQHRRYTLTIATSEPSWKTKMIQIIIN